MPLRGAFVGLVPPHVRLAPPQRAREASPSQSESFLGRQCCVVHWGALPRELTARGPDAGGELIRGR